MCKTVETSIETQMETKRRSFLWYSNNIVLKGGFKIHTRGEGFLSLQVACMQIRIKTANTSGTGDVSCEKLPRSHVGFQKKLHLALCL